MPLISVTRLRLRSLRFLPLFAADAVLSHRQVGRSPGFRRGAFLPDGVRTFWTMTAWNSLEDMRQFMMTGSHRTSMLHLLEWCDEASVVHWHQAGDVLPTWEEADRRMREEGRTSKVRYPSRHHATLSFRSPRVAKKGLVPPVRRKGGRRRGFTWVTR